MPPGTFSDYSCVGPHPFLSPSNTSQQAKAGLNRQRVCMLRNVCVVDTDLSDDVLEQQFIDEHAADFNTIFAMKRVRMYRPQDTVQMFGDSLRSSVLEQMMYQPLQGQADGEGLVHLHAWENHHGGDPSADKRVLGASPSVSYSQSPPSSPILHLYAMSHARLFVLF